MSKSLATYKAGFFDRAAVQGAVDRGIARVLSRFGAFVRTRARSSMRRRKKASRPGTPPSVHSKDPFATLRNILFAYEPARKSVVVGIVGLNGRRAAGAGVPELHEHGGTAVRTEVQLSGGLWVPAGVAKKRGARGPTRTRQARYPVRAAVGPAAQAERQGRLAEQLRGMVHN